MLGFPEKNGAIPNSWMVINHGKSLWKNMDDTWG
jgi:hypothetical protein